MESVSTQAFVNGSKAAGASQLKPGFAISPEDDLHYALGYPRVMYIIDGHSDDEPADVETWIQRCRVGYHPRNGVPAVSRGVAHRMLRLVGCEKLSEGREFSSEAHAAVMNSDELTLDEAKRCVRGYLEYQNSGPWNPAYLFESLFGPDPLVELIVSMLAPADPASIHDRYLNYYAQALAPLLRRASPAVVQTARQQLEPLYAAAPVELRPLNSLAANLGLALGGSAYAKEYGGSDRKRGRPLSGAIEESFLEWSEDDPAFVREQVLALPIQVPYETYPRLVFMAGDELLDRYGLILAKQKDGPTHARAIEQFGRIKSARATQIMLWFATKSKAKAEALAWLKRHEAIYEPFLTELKAESAESAKTVDAVLKKLKKM